MIRRTLLAAIAAASLAAPALAQNAYPPMPPVGPTKPFKVPAAETYRLPNGLQVTLLPNGQAPTATVSLRVYTGTLNEGPNTWLSTLTGQMLKEGAGGKSAGQLAEAAAGMGGQLSTAAGSHETFANIAVLSERTPDAVRLLVDVMRRPDFPEASLNRVKQTLARNLAVAKSTPGGQAAAALNRAYYGETHPFGRPYPSDAQLAGYTLDDVRRFHAAEFGARRARLFVAGRFDAAAVKAAIAAATGDWQAGPERLSLPPQPKAGPQVLLVDRPGAPQSTIRLAWTASPAGAPDDVRQRVTNALLGGAFSSRITKNIREDKGYTYSPNSGLTFNKDHALWTFNADVTTDVTGASLKEVFGEIRRLQAEAPGEAEAKGMSTYMAGVFVLSAASNAGLINQVATRDFHGLPGDWLDRYVPAVTAMKAEDYRTIARAKYPLEKATLVVVGDLAKVEPQLKALPELQGIEFRRVQP